GVDESARPPRGVDRRRGHPRHQRADLDDRTRVAVEPRQLAGRIEAAEAVMPSEQALPRAPHRLPGRAVRAVADHERRAARAEAREPLGGLGADRRRHDWLVVTGEAPEDPDDEEPESLDEEPLESPEDELEPLDVDDEPVESLEDVSPDDPFWSVDTDGSTAAAARA